MDYRVRKKIIIAFIFFIIIGIIGLSVYFAWLVFWNKPTCFDGILNQNEENVDCGGICLKECEEEKKQLSLLTYKIIPTLPNKYNVVLKFHNPNMDYGTAELNYKLNFFDESNKFIGDYKDFVYILPEEKKSVIVSALNFDIEPKIITVDFEDVSDVLWVKIREFENSRQINIKDKFYKELIGQTAFSEVHGVAVNRSDFDFDTVNVNIILFDGNKNIIDAAVTEIKSLLSGEEREFIVDWFYPVTYPNSVEIYAETNVFKSDNFIKRYGEIKKFQEL